jgi:hypothetical protein
MKRSNQIIFGLVVAHVLLHFVALQSFTTPARMTDPRAVFVRYVIFALGASQATLVLAWAALGSGNFAWRVYPAFLGTVVYLCWLPVKDADWLLTTCGPIFAWGPIFLLARILGFKVAEAFDDGEAPARLQFTIRDILAWTTGLAVTLSVLHYLPTTWIPRRPPPRELIFMFGGLLPNAIAALYCALGDRRLFVRLATMVLAPVVGVCVPVALDHDFNIGGLVLFYEAMAFWLIASLLLVRWAGYRLVWQWPYGRKRQEEVATAQK